MESVERHDRLYRERIKHFELFRIKTFGHIFLMGAVRLSEKVLESIRIYEFTIIFPRIAGGGVE